MFHSSKCSTINSTKILKKNTTVMVSKQTVPSPHPNSVVCLQDGRHSLRNQQQECTTSRKNKDVSREINEYLIRKTEWMLFHTVSFWMFNADPDAAALKWDETWCYMAELIKWQAHLHVWIHVHSLTHSSSSNWVKELNPPVMLLYNLHWDGRKQGERMDSNHEVLT